MSRKAQRDNEDDRDMTLGKRNFRRFLVDSNRAKEYDRMIRSSPTGRYKTLAEWEAELKEDA